MVKAPLLYVKVTVIPEFGNPACEYLKVLASGERVLITQQGFGQARKAGKPWTQEVIVKGIWVQTPSPERGEGELTLCFAPFNPAPVDIPISLPTPATEPEPEPEPNFIKCAAEDARVTQEIQSKLHPEPAVLRKAPGRISRQQLAVSVQDAPPAPVKTRCVCNSCRMYRVCVSGLCQFCQRGQKVIQPGRLTV